MSATETPAAPRSRSGKRERLPIVSGKRLLDTALLCDFLVISDDSLARLLEDPDEHFPKPVEIVRGKRHWALEDVEKYVAAKQKRAKDGDRR